MQGMLQFCAEGPDQTLKACRIPFIKSGRRVRTKPQLKGGLSQLEQRHTHMGTAILLTHPPMRSIGKRALGKKRGARTIHQQLAQLLPRQRTPDRILRALHAFGQGIRHRNERRIPAMAKTAKDACYRIMLPQKGEQIGQRKGKPHLLEHQQARFPAKLQRGIGKRRVRTTWGFFRHELPRSMFSLKLVLKF